MSNEKIDYTPRPARGRKARAAPAPVPPEEGDDRGVGDAPQPARREEQAPPAPRKRSAEQAVDYTPQPPRREPRPQAAREGGYAPRPARVVKKKRGPARSTPRFNVKSLLRSRALMVVAVVGGLLVLVVVPVVSELLGVFGSSANALVSQGNQYYDRGIQLWNQQDTAGAEAAFEQAISSYEQALAKSPEDAQVRTDMGTMYYYLGYLRDDAASVQKAIAAWNLALQYQPDKAETLYSLGQGYAWLGQVDQAIAAWQQVIAVAPGSEMATNAEQWIQEYSAPTPTPSTPND